MTAERTPYPRIGDLAAIRDGHSVALLRRDGQVEFFCPRRFDPPPLVLPLQDSSPRGASRTGTSGRVAELAVAGQPVSRGARR